MTTLNQKLKQLENPKLFENINFLSTALPEEIIEKTGLSDLELISLINDFENDIFETEQVLMYIFEEKNEDLIDAFISMNEINKDSLINDFDSFLRNNSNNDCIRFEREFIEDCADFYED